MKHVHARVDKALSIFSWPAPLLRCVLAMAAIAMGSSPTAAQCERLKVQADAPEVGDRFGRTVAMSGEWAAIGITTDATNGDFAGAVAMYRFDRPSASWAFAQKVIPADNEAFDGFGARVALDGSMLVVIAGGDDDQAPDAGAAYVFRLQDDSGLWEQESKLHASDGAATHRFGATLSCSGNAFAVGASSMPSNFGRAAVYVYQRDRNGSWSQIQIIELRDEPMQFFGFAVDIDDGWLAISSYLDFYSGDPSIQRVHFYRFDERSNSWVRHSHVDSPDGELSDLFGICVALDNGRMISGATTLVSGEYWAQSAYVFRYVESADAWQSEARLINPQTPLTGIWVDRWVDIDANRAAVGAPMDSALGILAGRVFTYARDDRTNTWALEAALPGTASGPNERGFGYTVAVDENRLMVGVPGLTNGSQPISAGSVGLYDLTGNDCNANSRCDDLDIATGTSSDRNANGVPDECETLPGDANGDGVVNADDLLAVLLAWGACPAPPVACPADVAPYGAGDGVINVSDLLAVIANWGAQL